MRLRMDWILFWTILILVSFGLVMVYSASSVAEELKRDPQQSVVPGASGPAAEASRQERPTGQFSLRRIGFMIAGLVGLFFVISKYREGAITWAWAAFGIAGMLFLQMIAYWMEVDKTPHYSLLLRQAGAALTGFVCLMYVSQKDYREFRSAQWAFAWLGIVVFLLIVVYFTGSQRRWLHVGISVQPSELAKPALVLFLAWFVTMRSPSTINSRHTLWPAVLALSFPIGAVAEPDFGTAIVLVATAAAVFYLAGLNWRQTALLVSIGLLMLTVAIAIKPYRVKRVIDFVDPEYKMLSYVDPGQRLSEYARKGSKIQDTRHQAMQSTIAIGAGGLLGRGLMQSRQKLLFLPMAHNDYIYAIVAEELGLWGPSLILLGFLVILWRGYRLYWTAADDFGRYIAVGVSTTLVFQALLNMSVVLDLGPTKGIPLPLISSGGSSMISSMILLGLLLSVSQRSSAH